MDSRSIPNPRRHVAKLKLLGLTVKGFALRHRFNSRTVKAAIRGERHGPTSKKIVAKLDSL